MGARGWTRAAALAVVLCAAARAGAEVQVEPIARLALEGGYDSNVMYDGRGDGMGRVSPDLGVELRDHLWAGAATAGGDLLVYDRRQGAPVWNQRGKLVLRARPERRLDLAIDADGTYANDPIGLARLGIIGRSGAALVVRGGVRTTWRAEHDWKLSASVNERTVRFGDGTGAMATVPGVEAVHLLGPRAELGAAYRSDVFHSFGGTRPNAYAQELSLVGRYQATRRILVEGDAGPTLWTSARQTTLLPQAGLQVLAAGRVLDARLTLRHGVGLGITAEPGLFDAMEGAFTWKPYRSLQIHLASGLWRSGAVPWGANGVVAYGVESEVAWRFARGLLVGVGASRYALLSVADTTYDRNIVGLRVGWELEPNHRRSF